MNKLFIVLAALFAIVMANPEPPVAAFDPDDPMSGKNINPELLSRIVEIYSRAGSAAAAQGSRSSQSSSGSFGGGIASQAAAATGLGNFKIDEIQFAPVVDEFDFPAGSPPAGPSGRGQAPRGYPSAPQQSRVYSAPAQQSYNAPPSQGYSASSQGRGYY